MKYFISTMDAGKHLIAFPRDHTDLNGRPQREYYFRTAFAFLMLYSVCLFVCFIVMDHIKTSGRNRLASSSTAATSGAWAAFVISLIHQAPLSQFSPRPANLSIWNGHVLDRQMPDTAEQKEINLARWWWRRESVWFSSLHSVTETSAGNPLPYSSACVRKCSTFPAITQTTCGQRVVGSLFINV